MKKIVLISMLCMMGLQGFSQQDPQYSLYMFNPLGVNPGYAGSREVLSAVLIHRSQWIGMDGAPETQVLSINTPLKNKKMGLGLQIVNDNIGAHTNQTLKAIPGTTQELIARPELFTSELLQRKSEIPPISAEMAGFQSFFAKVPK